MSAGINLTFCGMTNLIAFDGDVESLWESLANELGLMEHFSAKSRCEHEDYPWNLGNDEEVCMLYETIEDEDPPPTAQLQVNVQIDVSSIPDASAPDECWINNFSDLQSALKIIAPPDQYTFDIMFFGNDEAIFDDTSLWEGLTMLEDEGPVMVSLGNVVSLYQPVVPPGGPPVPNPNDPAEKPVVEPDVDPVEPESGEDEDWDDIESDPNWDFSDDGGLNEWPLLVGQEDASEEDTKEVEEPPSNEPPVFNGDGLLPVEEDQKKAEDPGRSEVAQPRRSGGHDDLREWNQIKASILFEAGDRDPFAGVTDEEKQGYGKKDLRGERFVEIAKTPSGASFICDQIEHHLKGRQIKSLIEIICDDKKQTKNIREIGESWYGAQIIRTLLLKNRFVEKLFNEIRMNCKDLVKSPPGALTVQYVFEVASTQMKDSGRQRMLLNILLARGKKHKRLQQLLHMSRHPWGSVLMQVAMVNLPHIDGHEYVCQVLSELPADQLFELCTDPRGYLFVQALIATYLAETQQQKIEQDNCHVHIWTNMKKIAGDLTADPRGRYVLAAAMRCSPETHRSDIGRIIDSNSEHYQDVMDVLETRGGPGYDVAPAFSPNGGEEFVTGHVLSWDDQTGEGTIDYLGSTYRFYRADVEGLTPAVHTRVMFRISETGHAARVVICE